MKKKKLSLLVKLLLWINLISLMVIVTLSSTTMIKMMEGEEKMLANDMENFVKFASLASGDYIWNLNTPLLDTTAEQLLENPSLEAVSFYDAKNVAIVTKNKKDSGFQTANDKAKKELYRTLKQPINFGPKKDTIGNIEVTYNLKSVEEIKNEFLKSTFIGTILAQIFLGLFLFFILKKTTISLQLIGEKLKVVSEKNQLSSEVVQKISEEVSSASTEQASSIQETVATLDEISSMINTAVEGSLNSTKKAEESLKIAEGGKLVVGRMIKSMEEIDQSNNTIMEEIKKGNERMAGIAKVISEISQKTTIINDIVFQTKLLSFNASVEAARAGEHGKGFAVVAEEVGNLAQMSGKASNEISQMLGTSINTVNNIILETNESIQVLFKMGNEKIKEGVAIADECGKVLDDVVENAEVVRSMMKEVSVASMEQSTGMKNIASAMNQLDQTTLNNSNTAQKSFQSSKELSVQVIDLKNTVGELEYEIFGS